jgi:uncharacterized damage-inducible protein DinB
MLARVPNDRYSWKPHEKSMNVQQLVTHVAELPSWVSMVLHIDELDFAKTPYQPVAITNTEQLLAYFEQSLIEGKEALNQAREAQLEENWTLRNGEQVYSTSPKSEVIRMCFCQIVHHRAHLGVYLRLLNIPIPGSYGPSADEAE